MVMLSPSMMVMFSTAASVMMAGSSGTGSSLSLLQELNIAILIASTAKDKRYFFILL